MGMAHRLICEKPVKKTKRMGGGGRGGGGGGGGGEGGKGGGVVRGVQRKGGFRVFISL